MKLSLRVPLVALCLGVFCSACTDDPAPPATPRAATPAEPCKGIVKSATGNCSEEMFCKYGLTAFLAVNESIVTRATASGIEADLGDSFVKLLADTDPLKVPNFKRNLAILLVNVYGGDKVVYPYEGSDMKLAHTGLNITAAQYEAFVTKVVVPALIDNKVSEADINNCFAPVVLDPALKAQIVQK